MRSTNRQATFCGNVGWKKYCFWSEADICLPAITFFLSKNAAYRFAHIRRRIIATSW